MPQTNKALSITLGVSRVKALARTAAWGAPATVCALISVAMYGRLRLAPSGMYNRLVEYSLAACTIPIVCAGVIFAFLAVRWFLLALWPGVVGIIANEEGLLLRLGSFGTRHLAASGLDIRYPFELEVDDGETSVEAFLPEEQQFSTLLPRILTPGVSEPVNFTILRFIALSEADAAAALRPWVEAWQNRYMAREITASESEV